MVFQLPAQSKTYKLPSSTPAQKPLVTSSKQITNAPTYKIPSIPTKIAPKLNEEPALSKPLVSYAETNALFTKYGITPEQRKNIRISQDGITPTDVIRIIKDTTGKTVGAPSSAVTLNMQTKELAAPVKIDTSVKPYTIPNNPYTIPNKPYTIPNLPTSKVFKVPEQSQVIRQNINNGFVPNAVRSSSIQQPNNVPNLAFTAPSIQNARVSTALKEMYPNFENIQKPEVSVPVSQYRVATVPSSQSQIKTWKYDPKADTYNSMTLAKTPEEQPELDPENGLPVGVSEAYKELVKSGISGKKYTFGNIEGIQGSKVDPTEYICQNYAIDAVNYLNDKGYDVSLVNLYGTKLENGDAIWHSIIAINDKSRNYIYTIDPLGTLTHSTGDLLSDQLVTKLKDPGNYTPISISRLPTLVASESEKTFVEPQDNFAKNLDNNIVGNSMYIGDAIYTIDHIEIIKNPIQGESYMPDVKTSGIEPIGDMELSQIDLSSPMAQKQIEIDDRMAYNAWSVTGTDSKVTSLNLDSSMSIKDMSFTLANQIYGPDFSIPEMVEIYQFLQKYSKDGKFDMSKLGEINKEIGSYKVDIVDPSYQIFGPREEPDTMYPVDIQKENNSITIRGDGSILFPDSYIDESKKSSNGYTIYAKKLIQDNPNLPVELIVSILYPEYKESDQAFKNAVSSISSAIKNNDYDALSNIKIFLYPDGSYSRQYDSRYDRTIMTGQTFNRLVEKYGGMVNDNKIVFPTLGQITRFNKEYNSIVQK
jgi:hypothetical protein